MRDGPPSRKELAKQHVGGGCSEQAAAVTGSAEGGREASWPRPDAEAETVSEAKAHELRAGSMQNKVGGSTKNSRQVNEHD